MVSHMVFLGIEEVSRCAEPVRNCSFCLPIRFIDVSQEGHDLPEGSLPGGVPLRAFQDLLGLLYSAPLPPHLREKQLVECDCIITEDV